MANEYVSATQLKVPLNISDSSDDTWLAIVATAASRAIDSWCGRRFYADSVATARVFYPSDVNDVWIDDALEITAVKLDTGGDGTFSTTLTVTTDYITLPLNGVGINRQSGWPTTRLRMVGARNLCSPARLRPYVQVTAKWGWTATPTEVTQAAYIIGGQLFRAKDAPFGEAGVGDLGLSKINQSSSAKALLMDFRREGVGGMLVA